MSFLHSTEALNVISKFYMSDLMVYVEGDDDVLFWNYYFRKYGENLKFKVEKTGSCNDLKPYTQKILEEDARIIVALDRDYNWFLPNIKTHTRILYTYGYSIENTLFCSSSINIMISNLYKYLINFELDIKLWQAEFGDSFFELLKYDIANYVYEKGMSVLGDTCCRFLDENQNWRVDTQKVNNYIDEIKDNFSIDEIANIEKLLNISTFSKWFIIKGHFLEHGVINFVSGYVSEKINKKRKKINTDLLYSFVIDRCNRCGNSCDQNDYYKTIIDTVINSLT